MRQAYADVWRTWPDRPLLVAFWAGAAGPILGGALSAVGGLFGASKSQDMVREQMAFQREMANTQYQRAAKDLEKAGLNRILALGSPAAAPGGASANIGNPLSGVASSAKSVGLYNEQRKLLQKQQDLVDTQAYESLTRGLANDAQGVLLLKNSVGQELSNTLKQQEVEFFRKNPLLFEFNLMNNSAGQAIRGASAVGNMLKGPLGRALDKAFPRVQDVIRFGSGLTRKIIR